MQTTSALEKIAELQREIAERAAQVEKIKDDVKRSAVATPFSHQVLDALIDRGYWMHYGPVCASIILIVARKMQDTGRSQVEVWNHHLMQAVNLGNKNTLHKYRLKCMESGWLLYTGRDDLGRKHPGIYTVKIP